MSSSAYPDSGFGRFAPEVDLSGDHVHILGRPVHYNKFHFVVTTFKRELEDNPVVQRGINRMEKQFGFTPGTVGVWFCKDARRDFDQRLLSSEFLI